MPSWANNLTALCMAALFGAVPAAATPPHIIWVEDKLFAQTPDTLLVLRTINDNHGSHFTHQTDTFLLTLSRDDGALMEVQPIERAVAQYVGMPEDGTTYATLPEAANPFAVRAAMTAEPLTEPLAMYFRTAMVHPTGVLVFEDDTLTHRLPLEDAQAQIVSSLKATRAVLPVVYRPDDVDYFYPAETLSVMRDCRADRVVAHWPEETEPESYVRLSCEDWDVGGDNIYWIIVPPHPE